MIGSKTAPHTALCPAFLCILTVGAAYCAAGELRPTPGIEKARRETNPLPIPKLGSYTAELFGKRYRLDTRPGLEAYIRALDYEIERSKREEPLGQAHEKDPLHHRVPKRFVSKKLRHAMEET